MSTQLTLSFVRIALYRIHHLFLVICLLLSFSLSSADSLVVAIPEGTERILPAAILKQQQVLLDEQGTYDITRLLTDPEVPWEIYAPGYIEGNDYYGWTKTSYRNDGTTPRHDYLIFSHISEDPRAYVARDTGMDPGVTGGDLRTIPGLNVTLPLYLAPGETVTVYFRGHFTHWSLMSTMYTTTLISDSLAFQRRTSDFSQVYLYLGILLSLFVFSSLLFFFFRQNAIIFFAILLLGFGGYFYHLFGITGIFPEFLIRYLVIKLNLFTSLIFLGLSGFIINYLDLRNRSPKLYPWYLGTVLMVLILSFSQLLYLFSIIIPLSFPNIAALIWATFTILLVVLAAKKGGRSEMILLLSFGILFMASFVYILAIISGTFRIDLRRLFMWSTLGLTVIIFYGIYDKLTAGIRENQRLTDQQRFRTRFFANITHEFRTPLTLILGPIKQLLQSSQSPAERELLNIAERNAHRQLYLVNQILDLSRTEASRSILEAVPVNLVPLLRRLTLTYESLAQQRNITLAFTTELSSLTVMAESAKLETIIYNLLTNAFKFTPAGGTITVLLEATKDTALITVRDTGNGIPAAALPFIFNRFYTDASNAEAPMDSSGIGLTLSRELVLLHGGTIEVSSEPNVRTDFRIGLPFTPGLQAIAPAQKNNEADPIVLDLFDVAQTPAISKPTTPKNAPLVLIVEDNADMRTYLSRGLEGKYRVRTAPNGREGVELARRLMPSLVVSDIMMPEMNGFELCLDLKTEITTSHIPVILLTARSASRDRLHGLDTGADDYLVKPFEIKELLARIRNLIRSRESLRELFAKSITLKPSEVTATPIDQEFLTTAIQAVEDHIDDELFDIEQLAQHMAMSRTSLNRKFRALLNQSSNHFIRSIRLERAAELLLKTDDTIAIVANNTGFGSATYFIKSFREKFGMTPGAYRKK